LYDPTGRILPGVSVPAYRKLLIYHEIRFTEGVEPDDYHGLAAGTRAIEATLRLLEGFPEWAQQDGAKAS